MWWFFSLVKITEEHYAHFSPHYATRRAFQVLQGRNQQRTKISLAIPNVQVVAIERNKWRARQGSNLRPLVPETTRMLARLFCSIIYVLLVPWFYLLFGSSCCRNVVGNEPHRGGGCLPYLGCVQVYNEAPKFCAKINSCLKTLPSTENSRYRRQRPLA